MTRSSRIVLSVTLCLIGLSLASPATADDTCELPDVACAAQEEAKDDVHDAARGVSNAIERTPNVPAVGPVLDRVEALVDRVVPNDGPGAGPTDPPGPPVRDVSSDDPKGAADPPGRLDPDPVVSAGASTSIPVGDVGPGIDISARSGSRPEWPEEAARGPRRIAGGIIGSAVRGLLLVMVLFGTVLGFVTLQDRLDRDDPKLALAPIDPDVVRFE